MEWDAYGQLVPVGGSWLKKSSGHFSRTCPFSPIAANEDELASMHFGTAGQRDPEIGLFETAYVGHAQEQDFRARGSSGGMASWVAAELLRLGFVDGIAHVTAAPSNHGDGRMFRYCISRTVEDVRRGACSRYYPVEMSDVLRVISATPGRYAVVGVPCFIKAVSLLRIENAIFRDRIRYTLGLFCGHMKSARFADSIAVQMRVNPDDVAGVDYRIKAPGRPANWYRARVLLTGGGTHEKDWWDLADGDWGAGFFQNHACNFCDDVTAETADIAFGDAWVEPYSSDPAGTNVVIVRRAELNPVLRNAVHEGRLSLREVGSRFVADTQAAGLRQRREGLAYRLARLPPALRLRKRVSEAVPEIKLRRKLVYSTRHAIAMWSHRVFYISSAAKLPVLYLWWANVALRVYQALAYSRGTLGHLCDVVLSNRLIVRARSASQNSRDETP